MTDTFDYVIVGGGTAGCVLANRLTASGEQSVALLEAGGVDDGFWIPIPAGFSKLMSGSEFNWRFQTEPEPNVHERTIAIPRGKGLGGSSLINGMIFVRGQPQDYDAWEQAGAPGWSFADVLPYFKRLENFIDGESALRGAGGPVDIERVRERPAISRAFIDAAQQAGFDENPDYNGDRQDGFGYYQVNQRNGRRWSAVDAYLRPALKRSNLDVRTHAHVQRIDFDGRRARGVTYRTQGDVRQIHARREVILAAGTVQTPHVLELSGIGNPVALQAAGLPVFRPLEGVGENYIDHFATRMNWRVKVPVTLNEAARGWRLGLAAARYFLTRRGILTLGTGLAHGFVRTRAELDSPDVQYFFMHASYANAADRRLDRQPGMTIGVAQLRPQSRGTIHARSPDADIPPAMRPNFLSAPGDGETLVQGMRIARAIMNRSAMDAYRAHEMNPGPDVSSDEAWLDFARRTGQTIYHPIGTCKMGNTATDRTAVVDHRLKVSGLEGLRVVDASIMPSMVSGNTQAAVFMIAEKGADLIIEDARRGVAT